jgi:succinyl-diaminopimelate desuccinylase
LDAVAMTQRLVRIESQSTQPGQQDVLDLVQAQLSGSGLAILSDGNRPRRYLFACTESHASPVLLFACHADTVPLGAPNEWTHDPLSGELVDGRVYGRGTSDMKSGLAACLAALVAPGRDDVPRALLLTTDEETGCLGARAASDALRAVDVGAVVIPEPTNNAVLIGHRGALWLRLRARGLAAHGSTPHLGRNALLSLASAVLDIEAHLPRREHPVLGVTTVNVGRFSAGVAVNVVPDLAEAQLDIRYVEPGEVADVRQWLGDRHPTIESHVDVELPPVMTDPADPWVGSLSAARESVLVAPYFTDGSVLTGILPRVPIVICGPGRPDQAHCVDEHVEAAQIERAVTCYLATLDGWRTWTRPL